MRYGMERILIAPMQSILIHTTQVNTTPVARMGAITMKFSQPFVAPNHDAIRHKMAID